MSKDISALRVVKLKNELRVKYTKTHVGHENDLCHVEISPLKKDEIAFKLMEKVPKELYFEIFVLLL